MPDNLGPWSAHINALEHGYEILLVRKNPDVQGGRERWRDPYPCFTEWGAFRRARRLVKNRNRAQARIDAKQARVDRHAVGDHLAAGLREGLLAPYLDDAQRREPTHGIYRPPFEG